MAEALKARLVCLMKWQSRTTTAVAVLMALAAAEIAVRDEVAPAFGLRHALAVGTLGALSTAAVLGGMTLWQIFTAGRMAFGIGSGLAYTLLPVGLLLFGVQFRLSGRQGLSYTLLAIALLSWPGLFLIPHMLRLDVRRLLGVEVEEKP
jgi:hypothetical protein